MRATADTTPRKAKSRYERTAESEANAELHDLLRRLEELAGRVGDFLTRHPESCRCDLCRNLSYDFPEIIRADLAAARWTMLTVADSVEPMLPADAVQLAAMRAEALSTLTCAKGA